MEEKKRQKKCKVCGKNLRSDNKSLLCSDHYTIEYHKKKYRRTNAYKKL